ncbi:MAG TPA: hypothetical protein VEH06_05480 [Candidatus Bathyarchaeia archaeon]|nr:hypothetical protein [Candidatus Bathyarchaeia archaeon]
MKMQRSLVLFAMVALVALFAGTSMPASQQASAVRHIVHHNVIVVDPQAHGIPLLNATALKKEIAKEVKGPYGEKDVIGGMMSGGY